MLPTVLERKPDIHYCVNVELRHDHWLIRSSDCIIYIIYFYLLSYVMHVFIVVLFLYFYVNINKFCLLEFICCESHIFFRHTMYYWSLLYCYIILLNCFHRVIVVLHRRVLNMREVFKTPVTQWCYRCSSCRNCFTWRSGGLFEFLLIGDITL